MRVEILFKGKNQYHNERILFWVDKVDMLKDFKGNHNMLLHLSKGQNDIRGLLTKMLTTTYMKKQFDARINNDPKQPVTLLLNSSWVVDLNFTS